MILNIKLTKEQAEIVLGALEVQPFRAVASIIASIREQAEAQLNPVPAPEVPTQQ